MTPRIIAIAALILASCGRESETAYKAYWENQSASTVKILIFKDGVVRQSDTIILSPSASRMIAEGTNPGISGRAGFYSEIMSEDPNDSVVVIFDERFPVSHYNNLPAQLATKNIKRTSDRSLFNGSEAYEYTSEDIKKSFRRQVYRYVFTESDVQNAKN